jgi:hypothetical protein
VQDRLHAYRVELDGRIIGKIGAGERTDFEVEPGTSSPSHPLQLDREPGVVLRDQEGCGGHFECQPNGHSLSALVETFKSLGRHGDPWIDLREVTGEDIEGT